MGFGPKDAGVGAAWLGIPTYNINNVLGAIYQNTTGGVKWVVVSIECACQKTGTDLTGRLTIDAVVDVNTPPNQANKVVAVCGLGDVDSISLGGLDWNPNCIAVTHTMTFCVPASYYYMVFIEVQDANMGAWIRQWTEYNPS